MTAAELRTNLQEFKAGIRKTLNDPVADWTAVIPVVVAMLSGLTIYTGEIALQLAEMNARQTTEVAGQLAELMSHFRAFLVTDFATGAADYPEAEERADRIIASLRKAMGQ